MPWLWEISRREKQRICLKNIPREEWRRLKEKGMDLIWLMGMWKRSPYSVHRARNEPQLVTACSAILPDFQVEDLAGSPYAVGAYTPDPDFGSEQDLLNLRKTLEDEGLFLILDFVPNHTACDHRWIDENPSWYVQGNRDDKGNCEQGFFPAGHSPASPCIAHGRDPYFPPWTDTAQINYRNPDAIEGIIEVVCGISRFGHGLRCDMAMLVVSEVFRNTWAGYLKDGEWGQEFWPRAIQQAKSRAEHVIFLAEAYWGWETGLLKLGFDYAYDKGFRDLVVSGDAQGLKAHLSAPLKEQDRMIRFLENHDEPRAYAAVGPERIRSAMVVHSTLPGMRFWQHGQLQGNGIKVPVQLRRGPLETTSEEFSAFSERLLKEVDHSVFHDGEWALCKTTGWPDNPSHENLLAWCWRAVEERRLVVVNFNSTPSQGHVALPSGWLPASKQIVCSDGIKGETVVRQTAETAESGLYVSLAQWDFHLFRIWRG
jgi:hypothetical protein